MDIKKIQELLKLIEKYEKITEISIEEKAFKLHVKMMGSNAVVQGYSPVPFQFPTQPSPSSTTSEQATSTTTEDKKYIKSPIVGTFYSKSSPDTPSFVKVGDTVNAKTIVCIVESMKVFNEVEAEMEGVIKEVLVKDGSPVEHGQPLFLLV